MRRPFLFTTVIVITFLISFFLQPLQKTAGAADDPPAIFLPIIYKNTNSSQAIVVNHLSTDVHANPGLLDQRSPQSM